MIFYGKEESSNRFHEKKFDLQVYNNYLNLTSARSKLMEIDKNQIIKNNILRNHCRTVDPMKFLLHR